MLIEIDLLKWYGISIYIEIWKSIYWEWTKYSCHGLHGWKYVHHVSFGFLNINIGRARHEQSNYENIQIL